MAPKRQKQEPYDYETPQVSSRYPTLPHETSRDLLHVGARARKHVSDGHLTAGASKYSFTRDIAPQAPPPPMDFGEFRDLRQKSDLEQRIVRKPLKRTLDDDDDDQATDADDDMPEKPQSMSSVKAYFVPSNYKSGGDDEPMEDFEDATFLDNANFQS